MAFGMTSVFSTKVSAFDGTFTAPSDGQICDSLNKAEAALAYVTNPFLKALLQKAIDAAQGQYCGA
ncbi:MAG: hypothetical protein DMF84_18505 [Acidobacteria bacterium]|nr:MAG: hypothetical protein DMF84_18505 [Acidobacteriota bacterium]